MKFTYNEGKWGINIIMHPENVQEMAELARFASNAKSIKPNVWLTFRDDNPYLNIDLEKVKESVQSNSIKPLHK